ncbi:MAG TPA: RluA family pseudouridine synthase [Lachnospiraceae bacterium]|nr:RluA family pseudouridine synthase [Lachnospiraceae bacterium]
MQEIVITKNEEGYKLKKLCKNYLSEAPDSFIYKMLRKKNIKLNGKKADGSEILEKGDIVNFYLSDETIQSFQKSGVTNNREKVSSVRAEDIIYEDEDIIIVNKPSGILSQKSKADDISINEMILQYLLDNGKINNESLMTFKPSVCNRLDRNTSGLILAGKTPAGSKYLSQIIKNRSIRKYYQAVVKGQAKLKGIYKAHLTKDENNNQVDISDKGFIIETGFEVLEYNKELDITYLRVELITGKSHQIRAHLAHLGYPIIGDTKYGNKNTNEYFRKNYKIKSQMLTAYEVIFPHFDVSEDTCEDAIAKVARRLSGKNVNINKYLERI